MFLKGRENMTSSLTIREGVSADRQRELRGLNVPSLYVRVYHIMCHKPQSANGSLTIREGVSVFPGHSQNLSWFPHYT